MNRYPEPARANFSGIHSGFEPVGPQLQGRTLRLGTVSNGDRNTRVEIQRTYIGDSQTHRELSELFN